MLLTFLAPLSVVLVLVGGVVTEALRHQLISDVDGRLTAAEARSSGADGPAPDDSAGPGTIDERPGSPDFLGAPGQGAGTLAAELIGGVTRQAAVITDSGGELALASGQQARVAAVPVDGRPHTVNLAGGLDDYRLAATREADGDVVVTGLPLAGVRDALDELVTVEILAGLIGLALTALAGALVLRRTLRPLSSVAATAARVTDLPLGSGEVVLSERVPDSLAGIDDEVGRVGRALNRLLDHVEISLAARQASEMKVRQFVADASHELRTPLTSIRGYAEFIRSRHGTGQPPSPEEIAHTMRRVESEAVRMSVLVDELLLLARLEASRDLDVDRVNLSQLALDAVADARVASPAHRWRADLPPEPVWVPGDAVRLHQVLANLLTNVRVHTPRGTTATVGLRTQEGWVALTVTDDGPGIPPGLQAHVFERFARGDVSRSRTAGSTGLGLAIVAAVVTAHDGTVAVTSTPGQTQFTVRLPSETLGRLQSRLLQDAAASAGDLPQTS